MNATLPATLIRCNKCGNERNPDDPVNGFYRRPSGRYQGICRVCWRKYHQAYNARAAGMAPQVIGQDGQDAYATVYEARTRLRQGFLLLANRGEVNQFVPPFQSYPLDTPFTDEQRGYAVIAEIRPHRFVGEDRHRYTFWIALSRTHITETEAATVRRLALRLKRERER